MEHIFAPPKVLDSGICPECGKRMSEVTVKGNEIHRCENPECGFNPSFCIYQDATIPKDC